MKFDLKRARECTQFIINQEPKSCPASQKETADLLKALLENKQLLSIRAPKGFFINDDIKKLREHRLNNARELLKHAHITVHYDSVDSSVHYSSSSSFSSDKTSFYEATRIKFSEFRLKEGIPEADLKLEALKDYMLSELKKCRYLQKCRFWELEPTPFLNDRQNNILANIISRNKKYNSKYQVDWSLRVGVAFGAMGLLSGLLLNFLLGGLSILGIAKGLLGGAAGLCAGVNGGSAFSLLREKFLLSYGSVKLQELKENSIPKDESIHASLIAGLESKTWKGYLNSFRNIKSYNILSENYQAYAAGLYTGVNRLEVQKEAIKKLRPQ